MDSELSSDDEQQQQHGIVTTETNNNRSTADMVSSFILHSPPGEFLEVLDDVKGILKDDTLIDDQVSKVFPKYTKRQLTPVKLEPSHEFSVILSDFNDLGQNRFYDPRYRKSFTYNHIAGSICDILPWTPDSSLAETWRCALELEWTKYSSEHYHEGAGSVFASTEQTNESTIILNACLEGHQFQPKKFWNGRWRSVWSISFNPAKDKQAELKGIIRLHVHYYEDGNVQLVSSRHCDQKLNITKPEQLAKDITDAVKKLENDYQRAISENYQTMSDTTFKALRRPLPVIRSKIEWNKLMGYKIGSELKQQ